MSLRDLFVFSVVALSIPFGFRVPFAGLMTFTWLAYMRAQDLCWGFARTMRFSYFVAAVMLFGWLAHGTRPFTRWDIRTRLMVALAFVIAISLLGAKYDNAYVIQRYLEYVKIIIISLFTVGQIDSRKRLRLMLWTIALSLGFFGFKGGLHGVLSFGAEIHRGPGGMLEDNNDFALALTMNIPLLMYLGFLEENRWVRRFCVLSVFLSVVTILLTHSRGGFLAMSAVMAVFVWRSKNRAMGFGLAALGVIAFFLLTPQHVLDRLSTIETYQQDSSAHARLTAWTVASRMIMAHPVLGVGMRNFRANWAEFSVGLVAPGAKFAFVAHNSYLQIWAESGSIAFFLFLTILGSCFYTLRKLRIRALQTDGADWIFHYTRMFEASLVGFVVGATFLNRGHFDLFYHIVAIISAFQMIAWRWLGQPAHEREGAELLDERRLPRAHGQRQAFVE